MNYTQEKNAAIEAVTRAARLCMQVREDMVSVDAIQKDDKSPVTIADFGAQAVVCQHLKAVFPQDPIVGEEDSADLQNAENAGQLAQVTVYVRDIYPNATPDQICNWIDAGNAAVANRYWTLDPIDGTKGFLRNDQYAVALALVENGQIQVGVLACPALPMTLDAPDGEAGVLFVAVRGEGATMVSLAGGQATPIQVSQASEGASLRFVESVEAGHGNQVLQGAIARAAGISQPSLRMDSQAKYGAVARGDAVLYLRLPSPKYPGYREKIWDHAAGVLVVEEAGGRVTDMFGRPLDFAADIRMNDNQGVVVSAGPFHDAVIAALAEHMAETT
jgi:3'(2'), 5'-bisphosphate nucleotidase